MTNDMFKSKPDQLLDATLIADPMFVVENTTDDFYVECCQCGRRYYLIVKEKK